MPILNLVSVSLSRSTLARKRHMEAYGGMWFCLGIPPLLLGKRADYLLGKLSIFSFKYVQLSKRFCVVIHNLACSSYYLLINYPFHLNCVMWTFLISDFRWNLTKNVLWQSHLWSNVGVGFHSTNLTKHNQRVNIKFRFGKPPFF